MSRADEDSNSEEEEERPKKKKKKSKAEDSDEDISDVDDEIDEDELAGLQEDAGLPLILKHSLDPRQCKFSTPFLISRRSVRSLSESHLPELRRCAMWIQQAACTPRAPFPSRIRRRPRLTRARRRRDHREQAGALRDAQQGPPPFVLSGHAASLTPY